MEKLTLSCPAGQQMTKKVQVQVGIVSSGDMEVLFESSDSDLNLTVSILSTSDNSAERWRNLFDRLTVSTCLPAGRMWIHDFGATPGVARLRIEQSLEKAFYV